LRSLRLFPSRLDRRARRVYGAVSLFFAAAFIALLWPVYPLFGHARPLILGLPPSLFYLAALLVACFVVLLGLYRWEATRGRLDGAPGDDGGADP
jgi:TRAP-type C4-dicarboxylate transport system permease small subunit